MRRGIISSVVSGATFDANTSSLNGSTQYYTVPHQTYYQTSNITVSAFVRITSLGINQTIINKQDRNSNSTQSWSLRVNTSDQLEIFIRQSGATIVIMTDTVSLSADTWYHVGFTFDGATSRLYKDGVNIQSSSTVSSIQQTTEPVLIGSAISLTTPQRFLAGSIALVDIQSITLSTPQMLDLATATCFDDRSVNATSVGYWSLANGGDLAIGQEETDLSVNGNDLTPVGSPTYTDQDLVVQCA